MGQNYVIELTSVDLRQKLEQENETALEESLLPFGVVSRVEPVAFIPLAVKKNDDSWIFAGDDEYDNHMFQKHGSSGWVH
jgi:trehalose-6-phosphatase